MNPFQIVRLTPKSNCGQCGYPSCLAFATMVSRQGEEAAKCPFIDPAALASCQPLPTSGAGTDLSPAAAKEQMLITHLRHKIHDLDFAVIAAGLGADSGKDRSGRPTLLFSYLGREVRVDKQQTLLDGAPLEDPRDQILLYNYIASGGGRTPNNTWIGLESLPNSISKVRTLATYCEERIAALLTGRRPDLLPELAARLNGVAGPADLGATATAAMIIPVLPMLPLYVLFWNAAQEEGFSARIKVLFDHHVLDFLDLESLVFAAERLTDRLLELHRT
jgi:hypothetical protein